jgi:hypothetical protein
LYGEIKGATGGADVQVEIDTNPAHALIWAYLWPSVRVPLEEAVFSSVGYPIFLFMEMELEDHDVR